MAKFKEPEGFSEDDERLTVVGEGIDQTDFDTLKENNWLNDKVRKIVFHFFYNIIICN